MPNKFYSLLQILRSLRSLPHSHTSTPSIAKLRLLFTTVFAEPPSAFVIAGKWKAHGWTTLVQYIVEQYFIIIIFLQGT